MGKQLAQVPEMRLKLSCRFAIVNIAASQRGRGHFARRIEKRQLRHGCPPLSLPVIPNPSRCIGSGRCEESAFSFSCTGPRITAPALPSFLLD